MNNPPPKRVSTDEPWYHAGLAFACTGCGACCTGAPGYVWVNQDEIEAMARLLNMDEASFTRTYVRHVGQRRSLREHDNGDCFLFDPVARRCTVYAVRPRQCRSWPFWASNLRSPSAWQRVCRACPGAGHGPLIALANIETMRGLIQI